MSRISFSIRNYRLANIKSFLYVLQTTRSRSSQSSLDFLIYASLNLSIRAFHRFMRFVLIYSLFYYSTSTLSSIFSRIISLTNELHYQLRELSLLSTLRLIAMTGRERPDRSPFRSGHHYKHIYIHDRAYLGDSINEFVLEILKSIVYIREELSADYNFSIDFKVVINTNISITTSSRQSDSSLTTLIDLNFKIVSRNNYIIALNKRNQILRFLLYRDSKRQKSRN